MARREPAVRRGARKEQSGLGAGIALPGSAFAATRRPGPVALLPSGCCAHALVQRLWGA